MAAVMLGVLLEEQGDADGAKAAYQQAIDSGHADMAPMAAVNLGNRREERLYDGLTGRIRMALAYYRPLAAVEGVTFHLHRTALYKALRAAFLIAADRKGDSSAATACTRCGTRWRPGRSGTL
jgi:hypothetical protein